MKRFLAICAYSNQFENPLEVKATTHVRPTAGKCLHAQQNATSACCDLRTTELEKIDVHQPVSL